MVRVFLNAVAVLFFPEIRGSVIRLKNFRNHLLRSLMSTARAPETLLKRLSFRDKLPEVALTFLKRLPGGAEIKERKFGGLKNDPRHSGEVFCSDPCK